MRIATGLLCAIVLAVLLPGGQPVTAAGSCPDVAKLAVPNTTITMAEPVAAGAFTAPGAGGAAAFQSLPAFCRVAATVKPSSDSDIKIEVWLPAANWNSKFEAVGNGAFMGSIPYAAMARALGRGYAVGGTDTGHTGGSASFGLGHPEKVVDFGWRAVHELAEVSKKVIANYYETAPKDWYWDGCSAGGRQGMQAAQRFPADFDGIVAGAPGLDWTGRAAQAVRIEQMLAGNDAGRLLAPQRQLLHKGALDACDANDGVKDGVIDSPQKCKFDPAVLECRTADQAGCLTKAQVQTAVQMYAPTMNKKGAREIAGLLPGSEPGWSDAGWTASARATGLDQFRFLVFGNPNWTIQQFDFDADIARADDVDQGIINALQPNLKPFIDRGGKLIQYHGWSDPQISPANSTAYFTRALEASGGASKVHASYRLFMAPGMGHCSGGDGPNTFDMMAALEQWVEQGKAPDQILATHSSGGRVDRTRPLCPYPQVATYKGSGSTDEAASFTCKAP